MQIRIRKSITVKKDLIILGIESSCDDTSAAICKNGNILANNLNDVYEVEKDE